MKGVDDEIVISAERSGPARIGVSHERNDRLSLRFNEMNKTPDANYNTFKKAIENPEPEICANVMICLIKITTYLLSRQLKTLETAFINEGGLRERMTKARIDKRNKR